MSLSVVFFFNSILLGVGLAMDAFSVSVANGLAEPRMRTRKRVIIAGTFAFFQCIMPLIGWVCVHYVAERFEAFQKAVPWIALILLLFIGGKMLIESIMELREKKRAGEDDSASAKVVRLSGMALLVQGIATSIDALSVGFAISGYHAVQALVCALIIAVVTYFISYAGLHIGKKLGEKLAGKAGILGGCILIFIGIEIFIRGVL